MAAPTDFRVEAIAQGSVVLRWTHISGANQLGIYRSTTSSVSGFSLAATVASLDGAYVDDGLVDKTRYWYKGSYDNGVTFTSPVVSVITYVDPTPHFDGNPGMSMPEPVNGEAFREHLQQFQNKEQLVNTPCDICIQNGAIVLDCSTGCQFFRVIVDQDINSISLVGCEECPYCDFIIPPNEEFGICGWPMGCQYTRDECFQAPVSGGTRGRTAKTNGLSYGGYGGPSAPRRPSQCCPCPFDSDGINVGSDALRVVSCDGDAMGCGDSFRIKACGGLGPYTWTKTGNVQLSDTTGICITATSTATPGTGNNPLELAYIKYHIGGANAETFPNNCGPGHNGWAVNTAILSTDHYNCEQQLICNSQNGGCSGSGMDSSKSCGIAQTSPCIMTVSGCLPESDGCIGVPNFFSCCPEPSVSVLWRFDPQNAGIVTGCNGATVDFTSSVAAHTGDDPPNWKTVEIGITDFVDVRGSTSCQNGSQVCTQGSTTITVTDNAGVSATLVLA